MDNCQQQRAWRLLFNLCSATVLFFFIFLCLSCQLLWAADAVPAQNAQLHPKPNRCVALHQGQVCFQDILLSWQVDQAGEYCLYQNHAEHPLHCWEGLSASQYRYAFASDSSIKLQLVKMPAKTLIAEAIVEVAWVYKANTRRKTHWRLF